MTTEPVRWAASVQTLIGAVIALLIAFNAWNPTDGQQTAIFGAYAAVILVWGQYTRNKVTPAP